MQYTLLPHRNLLHYTYSGVNRHCTFALSSLDLKTIYKIHPKIYSKVSKNPVVVFLSKQWAGTEWNEQQRPVNSEQCRRKYLTRRPFLLPASHCPSARCPSFFSSFFCPSQIHWNSLFHFGRNVFKRKRVFYFKKLLFTCVRFFHLCQLKEKETLLPFLEISLLSLFTFLLF